MGAPRRLRYAGAVAEGQLVSGTVEVNPWNRFHLAFGSGSRLDTRAVVDVPGRRLSWSEVNADVAVGRSLFPMLSAYRERGDAGPSTQAYTAISWRF